MFKRLVASLLCVSMIVYAYGCSSTKAVSMEEYQEDPRSAISRVVLTDGSMVQFDDAAGRSGVLQGEEIVGFQKNGEVVHIPTSKVQSIYYTETDTGKSVLLGSGVLIGAAIVGAVIVMLVITDSIEGIFGK